MVDRARYCFKLTAWNELAGVDDSFLLIYYVRRRLRVPLLRAACVRPPRLRACPARPPSPDDARR